MSRYLSRLSCPDVGAGLAAVRGQQYGGVVVVPVCDELDYLPSCLASLAEAGSSCRALLILVVNSRDDHGERVHLHNEQLLGDLGASSGVTTLVEYDGLHLLVIDRTSAGRRLPKKHGVGLARKIGCDVALALVSQGVVAGGEGAWIFSTDADARVPRSYFRPDRGNRLGGLGDDPVALVHPFVHDLPATAEGDALVLYEIHLRLYVAGLARAGSPWAFDTVGSTLAIAAGAYATVRGFPRRQAGEDFHLLAKLAKTGAICTVASEPIELACRTSCRVPFGTGPATSVNMQRLAEAVEVTSYDPRVFDGVGEALRRLHGELASGGGDDGPVDPVGAALRELGATAALKRARAASDNPSVQRRHLHTWLDALKTLQLVHALRRVWPDVPWRQALPRSLRHLPARTVLDKLRAGARARDRYRGFVDPW